MMNPFDIELLYKDKIYKGFKIKNNKYISSEISTLEIFTFVINYLEDHKNKKIIDDKGKTYHLMDDHAQYIVSRILDDTMDMIQHCDFSQRVNLLNQPLINMILILLNPNEIEFLIKSSIIQD